MMHDLLRRQIRRAGCDPDSPPTLAAWRKALSRIDAAYAQADQERDMHSRAFDICSNEMRELVAVIQGERDQMGDILGQLREGVVALDRNGRVIQVNEAAIALFGSPEINAVSEQIDGWTGQLRPDQQGALASAVDRALCQGDGTESAVFVVGCDEGAKRHLEWSVIPTRTGSQSCAVLLTVRDVTESMIADTEKEVRASLFRALAQGAALHDTLCELLCAIESHISGVHGRVLLIDYAAGEIRHAASVSLPAAYLEALPSVSLDARMTSCGAAACTGKRYIASDISTDPLWTEYASVAIAHGVRACWSEPIIGPDDKPLGILALTCPSPREPTRQEEKALELCAKIAALAIERARANDAIKESEARFHQLFESSADAMFIHRPSGDIVDVNHTACQCLGYTRAALLQMSIWDLEVSPPFQTRAPMQMPATLLNRLRKGEYVTLEGMHRKKDGGEFPVEVRLAHYVDATGDLILASVRNISERMQALQSLRQSEERFRGVFSRSHDAIILIDAKEETIVEANPSACTMLAYTKDELYGLSLTAIHPNEMKRVRAFIRDVQVRGGAHSSEFTCRRSDGAFVCADIAASMMRNENGDELLLAIIRDASDERHARQELLRAKGAAEAASRSKSEFLANMSHEIRTPMTAIMGYADLLLDPDASQSDRVNHTEIIRRNGAHLLVIINDILDLSKIESGGMDIELVRCSPTQIIAEVMSLLQVRTQEKGIALSAEIMPPTPETIETDPTRLRQILLNLVGNAVKFTDEGGVRVIVKMATTAACDSPQLSFEVIDTGIGMDARQLERIWAPFQQGDSSTTRRFGGTGLGLAISKRLATALGGDLTVASELSEGSTFKLTVDTGPLRGIRMLYEACLATVSDVAERAERNKEAPIPTHIQGKILLAEDGPDNQRLISFVLRKAGADVEIAANGRAAVEMVIAAQQNNELYDMIFMDMQMPELDGYAATSKLRMKGFRLPIVALTAHAMAGDRERCIAAGCDDYITKPITKANLLRTCAMYLPVVDDAAKEAA